MEMVSSPLCESIVRLLELLREFVFMRNKVEGINGTLDKILNRLIFKLLAISELFLKYLILLV